MGDPVYCGRGRPPTRGKPWILASLVTTFSPQTISVFLYGKTLDLTVVVREMWIRDVTQKVRIVVVEGIKAPLIFLSTDLRLSANQIIEIYGARFSIEHALRSLKHQLGLADDQCTTWGAMVRFVHLACTALCLFRLLLLQEDGSSMDPPTDASGFSKEGPLSLSRVRRRFQRFAVEHILFSKSAPTADF